MVKLDKIKLVDISPAEYNPRKISDADKLKLRNSIDTFGVVDPIIINLRNNKIIGGHQRYEALLDKYMEDNSFFEELHLLKLGDIGWAFPNTDLSIENEDYEKALNLALNKISGEWDLPKLEDIFGEIIVDGFNTELTGFDTEELNEMFNFNDLGSDLDADFDLDGSEDFIEDDFAFDEVEEKAHTFYLVEGDEWKFGNHTFKVGEVNENDKFIIRIDFNDMHMTFKKIKGDKDDPLESFEKANKDCIGLKPESRR